MSRRFNFIRSSCNRQIVLDLVRRGKLHIFITTLNFKIALRSIEVPFELSLSKTFDLSTLTLCAYPSQIVMARIMSGEASPPPSPPSTTTDGYLAKPSGACCLKGTLHKGEARGQWETMADVDTYISTPTQDRSNGHVLLYFPDVWGMFPNGLLVMDAFADAGYTVLGLDYFRGVSYPLILVLEMQELMTIRIRCGNIERTVTTILIQTSTTKHGSASTQPLPM
jgi:hypothetical protein